MTTGGLSAEGRTLDGRYRLGALIGIGGVAEVYRAMDERLSRAVAVKLFRGDVADQLKRHEDEMRTLARLNHPSLVTVYDSGTDDLTQQPYLVMALVEGTTLADQLVAGPIAPQRAAEIGAAVADALAYIHGQGLVHRDVKPANVLVSDTGRVFLADFGIARLVDSAHITQAGDVLGTPAYFAPEQVTGEAVGPPADVYALGLVILECLTGYREYDGTSLEVAMARLNRQPQIPPRLSGGWRAVLTGMTARQPTSRLSAPQASERLARIATGDDADASATSAMTMPVAVPVPVPPAPTVAVPLPTAVLPPVVIPPAAPAPRAPATAETMGPADRAVADRSGDNRAGCGRHRRSQPVGYERRALPGGNADPQGPPRAGHACHRTAGVPMTGRRRLLAAVVLAATLASVSACGTGSSDRISKAASAELTPLVEALRTAANGTDLAAVQAAEMALNNEVSKLETSGEITPQRGQQIQDAAGVLLTAYAAHNTPSASPSITPSTSSPSPSDTPTSPAPTVTVTEVGPPPTTPVVSPTTSAPETPPATPTSTKTPH